jgi:hypothetical protein
MAYLAALVIFLGVATLVWFVAVAVYQALLGDPSLYRNPDFVGTSFASIILGTLLCFVPFPWGYFLTLGVWWLAARHILNLPLPRSLVLFLVLAALSFVSRLAILGALNF